MGTITLLRIMTRKSVFNGGQQDGMTVQSTLDLKMHRKLRYCYFMYSKISFTDDILDEIGIPAEYRIEKPGKKPEFVQIVNEYHEGRANGLYKIIIENTRKCKMKAHYVGNMKQDRLRYAKNRMQWKNQGHK